MERGAPLIHRELCIYRVPATANQGFICLHPDTYGQAVEPNCTPAPEFCPLPGDYEGRRK